MKVAIASDDGKTISYHFGRAAGFVVFEIQNGKITGREYRKNIGKHSEEHGSCDHAAMIKNLKDCSVMISHGMGQRIYDDMVKSGIEPIVTEEDSVDKAIEAFLKGKLESHTERLH